MGWMVNATPWLFYPQEWPSIYHLGGWVGPMAGLENLVLAGFDPWTNQPIASHYTNYVIKANNKKQKRK